MIRGMKRNKATKDWKTTVISIVAFLLVGLNLLYPEKFDPDTQAAITNSLTQVLAGVGALISVIIGIFSATDE